MARGVGGKERGKWREYESGKRDEKGKDGRKAVGEDEEEGERELEVK